MQTTPNGNVSAKIAPGKTFKRMMRIERIVRLEVGGFTDDEIAFSQGITSVRVGQLKRTPEYIALRTQLATGVVQQADRDMYEDINAVHALVRDMVPESLQAIRDAILDKSNPALRLRASQDLLDREGTLAKVSKTEIKKTVEYDFNQHDTIAGTLLEVLQANELQRSCSPELDDSALQDLQKSGILEFSRAALDKEQQKQLRESLELINNFVLPADSKVQ